LPSLMKKLYCEEYFSVNKHNTYESFKNHVIFGFTEYNKHGKVYRAHLNQLCKVMFYGWAVIKCPYDNIDIWYSGLSSESNCKKTNWETILVDPILYLTNKYGSDHVPARILAFYKHPSTFKDMALVHACRPMMEINVIRSSVITESWHLQHMVAKEDEDDTRSRSYLCPIYNSILAEAIVDRFYVFMESQEIEDTWEDEEGSGHVLVATKRSTHWASAFCSHYANH
jgi:hypothetical protein